MSTGLRATRPEWLNTLPRVAVSRRVMRRRKRPVSRSAATHNPQPVSIATAIRLSALSPASATYASIGKSTRRQARATPSHPQRAGFAARCAVRSEGVQRREPSAIT